MQTTRAMGSSKRPGWLERARAFLHARFDSGTHLGLHLTGALILGVVGIWLFSAVLDAVLDNATLVRLDHSVDVWIHQRTTASGMVGMHRFSYAGSPAAMTVLSVLGGLYLIRRRRWTVLVGWIAAFAGGMAIDTMLKQLVHRGRPRLAPPEFSQHTFSFPSGHAMGSFIGVGMLLYLLTLYWHPPRWMQWAARLAGVAFVVAIGVSRLYLGLHFPSDVMGGWTAGAVWMGVCISAVAVALHTQQVPTGGRQRERD